MTATTCQNLQFDKANTFRNFKKDSLGYFLANRWENYKDGGLLLILIRKNG